MDRVNRVYLVQGSAAKPYRVTVDVETGLMMCTCPHAMYRGAQCKHQIQVINGKAGEPLTQREQDLSLLAEMYPGED